MMAPSRTCDHDDFGPSIVVQDQRFIMCTHCKLKVALPVGDMPTRDLSPEINHSVTWGSSRSTSDGA